MSRKSQRLLPKSVVESLIQWSLFSVSVSLSPMLFSYVWILLSTRLPHPDFFTAVSSRGELLIVAAAILGEAISDMVKRNRAKNLNLFVAGCCLIPLILSCLVFASIQTSSPTQFLDKTLILKMSNGLFIYSLGMGAACKLFGKT